jgi:Transmembrane secretion effector
MGAGHRCERGSAPEVAFVVSQGGNAAGAAVMGVAAAHAGLAANLTIAAAGLALGPLAALRWRFRPIPPEDLPPAGDWPAPQLAPDRTPQGPVLVSVEYRARPGLEDELMTALRRAGSAAGAPAPPAGEPGRTPATLAGSSSNSSSPPGRSTSASSNAPPNATRAGWTGSGDDRLGTPGDRDPLASPRPAKAILLTPGFGHQLAATVTGAAVSHC